jgi:hypothetical protein
MLSMSQANMLTALSLRMLRMSHPLLLLQAACEPCPQQHWADQVRAGALLAG